MLEVALEHAPERVQEELEAVDRDIGAAPRPLGSDQPFGSGRTMNFAIRYLTQYVYDSQVVDNVNALRVKPQANGRQRCDEFSVHLTPATRLEHRRDRFGTEVVEFEISQPHRHLTIDVRAGANTDAPAEPPEAPWEALRDPSYRQAAGEFLHQTDDAPEHPVLEELLARTRAARTPLATALLISELISDRFEYRPGTTYVDSPITHLLKAGAGVCQDFVHLGLCLLRHHRIAARYVSGYLFAAPSAQEHESVEVDTHAWVEALLPMPSGGGPVWVGMDPTNRSLAGEAHVKIGHGRHYPDVPPIEGVYRGAADSELTARVTMTRRERTGRPSVARS
jgi:transglutaminase-like putative cysteine protease